jgi:hypothetical protein
MAQNKFNLFLQHRQSLLIQYRMGDLSKNEFIMENYDYLEYLGITPFERIDNVKKAIYNYHFFNVTAKYWARLSSDKHIPISEQNMCYENSIEAYRMKDAATLKLLRLIDFRGIEAFYVQVASQKLKNHLIEIVLRDPDLLLEISTLYPMTAAVDGDDLILHTRSEMIVRILKENGAFSDEKKASLAGCYINQKY